MRVVFLGVGAAGVATARLFLTAGVGDIVMVDRRGVVHRGREEGMNDEKRALARITNHAGVTGSLEDALRGADAFVGVSGPDLVSPEAIKAMSDKAIVFAMANPDPEILPEAVPENVAVVATGRSDYPNQINNVLVFPGFFRGLLDARAKRVEDDAKLAAARALADVLDEHELTPSHIVPSVFDVRAADAVASAVRACVGAP